MNTDQKHFKNRKLHSLVGVLPLGGFIAEHLLSNAFILGGQKSYESAVAWLLNMPKPILWTLEIVTIALPLAFHAIYGVKIAMDAKYNTGNYAYARNRNFMLQRLTSFYLLAFIIYHVWSTRFTGHFTTTYTPEAVDAATGLVRSQQSIYYFMLEKLSGQLDPRPRLLPRRLLGSLPLRQRIVDVLHLVGHHRRQEGAGWRPGDLHGGRSRALRARYRGRVAPRHHPKPLQGVRKS
jgi:succinate dehydrogenase/fumarate reductase cytochrome b subunit (b558 family)